MKWKYHEVDSSLIKEAVEKFNLNQVTAQILLDRGIIDPEEIRFFVDRELSSIPNPFLFDAMEDVIERIKEAIQDEESILIFGDRDVDGITSTAALYRYLGTLGLTVSWSIPEGDDHYGINEGKIEEFAAQGGGLIIALDCGITNIHEIQLAQSLGIDTIIVDHHNAGDELPPAIAIINPKESDYLDPQLGGQAYPFDGLCTIALVGKIIWALEFSKTEYYGQRFCLLNARPGNSGSVIIEAVKMQNFCEVSRISETFVAELPRFENSRLIEFLEGQEILVYDKKLQISLLQKVFGDQVDIFVHDLAPTIWETFPTLRGRSILRLLQNSKLQRFSNRKSEEIDAFLELMKSFITKKIQATYDVFVEYLDFVALGTVADLMPLRMENRVLVNRGLEQLFKTKNPGLRELLNRLDLANSKPTVKDLGWKLAPVINSTGRMGQPQLAVQLLIEEDFKTIQELAGKVISLNNERKQLGSKAWSEIRDQVESSFETYSSKLVLVKDPSIYRGITGILAGKLAREKKAPAIAVAEVNGNLVGSMRSFGNLKVTEYLKRYDDILDHWGGHDAAGGFRLKNKRWDEFLERTDDQVLFINNEETEEIKNIDVKLDEGLIGPQLWEWNKISEPHGQSFSQPVYWLEKVRLEKITILGSQQNHLRLDCKIGKKTVPALFWNGADQLNNSFKENDTVQIIFSLGRNYYRGNETLQFEIIDILQQDDARIETNI